MKRLLLFATFCLLLVSVSLAGTPEVRLIVGARVSLPEGTPNVREEMVNFLGTTIEELASPMLKAKVAGKLRQKIPPEVTGPIRLEVTVVPRTSMFSIKAFGAPDAICQNFLSALATEYLASKTEAKAKRYQDAIGRVTQALAAAKDNAELLKELTDYRNKLMFASLVDTQPTLEILREE